MINELYAAADQRHNAARTAGNINQVQIQAVFFEQTRLLGNPNRQHRTGDRAVAGIDLLQGRSRQIGRREYARKKKSKDTRR